MMTKNIMLEIRAGTGGDEASIWEIWFGCTRYAEPQNWKVKLVSESLAEMGGFKKASRNSGRQVYSKLKLKLESIGCSECQ